jgi:hypothetical protein
MESNNKEAKSLIEHIQGYFQTKLEIFQLKGIEKTSDFLSAFFSALILLQIGFAFLMLLTLALTVKISDSVNSAAKGFLIVAGIYFIIILLLIIFRKSLLRKPLINFFAARLLSKFDK